MLSSAYHVVVIAPGTKVDLTFFTSVFVIVLCAGEGEKEEEEKIRGVVKVHGWWSFQGVR